MANEFEFNFFSIAGENLGGSANSGTEIEVTWDQPTWQYVETNLTLTSPDLAGAV